MKYKIGEKVRLKILGSYCQEAVNDINNLLNREATIKGISSDGDYVMNEIRYLWSDEQIECSLGEYDSKKREEYKNRVVLTRFDLLDFED